MNSEDYPALYASADKASLAAQRQYVWLTRAEIGLMLLAAAIAALRVLGLVPSGPLAGVLAVVLLGAFGVRVANRVLRPDKIWFDGRAVAESIKSAAWRYAMHLEPFAGDHESARAALLSILDEALQSRRELTHVLEIDASRPLIGRSFNEIRGLSESERVQRYIADRLDDQQTWYRVKARENRRSGAFWYWTGLGAQLIAVAAAVLAIWMSSAFAVIGLLSAVATATTASAQLGRDDELARSYGLAAAELAQIKVALVEAMTRTGEPLADRVRDAEGAISREHTMWVAKRS